jgi:O-antigen/teichoic acid export membrane protein
MPLPLRRLFSHALFRRSALFSISVIASTVVGLVSIKLITDVLGTAGWGNLYLLQAINQFASILVAFGWGATGPASVAALAPEDRRQFLVDSLFARVPLLLVVGPLAIILGIALGSDPAMAILATLTYTVPGVGAAWYFVGTNRPLALLAYDALPAILGQIAGLIAVVIVPALWAYLAATAAFTMGGVLVGLIVALRGQDGARLHRPAPSALAAEMRTQGHGLVTLLFGNLATTLPAVLLQIFSPTAVPVFGMVDRIFRYGVIVLGPILQAAQSWVGEQADLLRTRARTVMWFSIGIGLAGGVCFATLAPVFSQLLGSIEISPLLAVIGAIAFASECIGQLVGLAGLVALGQGRVLSRSAVAGAVVTVGLLIPATGFGGVTGALAVVALPLVGVAVWRATALWRTTRPTPTLE